PRPLFQRPPPGPFGQGGAAPGPPFRAPPVRRGPPVRPRADPSQRPARVRGLPARPGRNPPRDRLLRAHPCRRPDLRHDPLRGQRAAVVRAAALTPEPIASTGPWRGCTRRTSSSASAGCARDVGLGGAVTAAGRRPAPAREPGGRRRLRRRIPPTPT